MEEEIRCAGINASAWLLQAAAIVLSDVMCAVVAYSYCSLQWCRQCSAPARTAFLFAIPYGIGIALCAGLSLFFLKREQAEKGAGD